MAPANAEASRMESLAVASMSGSTKASEAMKMDMVKPMPAKTPVLIMCCQLAPWGKEAMPERTANQQASVIPIGLPTTSPKTMPNRTGIVPPLNLSNEIATPGIGIGFLLVLGIANLAGVRNLIVYGVLGIVFWFNPIIRIYKKKNILF